MKIKGEAIFWAAICVGMLGMIILSLRTGTWSSKLLPVLIGSATLILSAVALLRELRASKKGHPKEEGIPLKEEVRGYLQAGFWIGGYFVLIYLLGIGVATVLFIFIYMKAHRTGLFQSLICAALTTAGVYSIFQYVMGVDLYPGVVFSLFR